MKEWSSARPSQASAGRTKRTDSSEGGWFCIHTYTIALWEETFCSAIKHVQYNKQNKLRRSQERWASSPIIEALRRQRTSSSEMNDVLLCNTLHGLRLGVRLRSEGGLCTQCDVCLGAFTQGKQRICQHFYWLAINHYEKRGLTSAFNFSF